MSPPWMPLYIADYIADTGHLGALESGGYMHLIMHYWRQGGLPKEDASLARIARMTPREWAKSRDVVLAFFDADLRHSRIDFELEKAREKSDKRSDAGSRGGKAKALKNKNAALANATILPEQNPANALASSSHSQSLKKDRTKVLSIERDAKFEQLRAEYPKRPGDHDAPARKAFDKVRAKGVAMEDLLSGAMAYRRTREGEDPKFTKALSAWLNVEGWKTDYSNSGFKSRAGPRQEPIFKNGFAAVHEAVSNGKFSDENDDACPFRPTTAGAGKAGPNAFDDGKNSGGPLLDLVATRADTG